MIVDKVLLVEGADDLHVVCNLLKHHDFPETFRVEEKGGIDKIMSVFPVQLKSSDIRAVGLVVDADLNLQNRWAAIKNRLVNSGYTDCPALLPPDGLVLQQPDMPKFGAWFMPDNILPGMLEDFVALLVPDDDPLWAYSKQAVGGLPEGIKEFSAQHHCKALIHTWLAWKSDPGTPMGLAIMKKYLEPEKPSVVTFLSWLNRLFVLD